MKYSKILTLLLAVILIFPVTAMGSTTSTMITVDKVSATVGETVDVPIRVSNNQGICGAKVTVNHDSGITLTGITKGQALSTLEMTKPGDFSDNPFNLVWDGMESDNSNGIIATLTFTVPQTTGVYNIDISYEYGYIVNGNLKPMTVEMVDGSITVVKKEEPKIPMIKVGSVSGKAGETVNVPVIITENPGILGATLTFTYDSGLTLTGATSGSAFSALTMTKPGKLVSPCNFVWDGQELAEEDIKNGIVINLEFKISETATAGSSYNIGVSYPTGYIIDKDMGRLTAKTQGGAVNVLSADATKITVAGKNVYIENIEGLVLVGFYSADDVLLSTVAHSSTDANINVENINSTAEYSKVMLWGSQLTIEPLCCEQTIGLK